MPQSSLPPSSAPPPRSGGGIYIIAVIALLLAIGGLVFWKLKGGGNEAQLAPVPQAPTVTNPNTFIEPPPPPPPVVEEQTGHADGGQRVATSGNGACSAAKCTGSSNNAIVSALS